MPRGVEHGSDYNGLFPLSYFVDNSVRKAPRITPANVLARMTPAMKRRIYGSSSNTARTSSTNLSPRPSLRLSYHAAISMTSFSASEANRSIPVVSTCSWLRWRKRKIQTCRLSNVNGGIGASFARQGKTPGFARASRRVQAPHNGPDPGYVDADPHANQSTT
jgi:hypothetical protein